MLDLKEKEMELEKLKGGRREGKTPKKKYSSLDVCVESNLGSSHGCPQSHMPNFPLENG